MTVPKHLNDAAGRLKEASERIEQARRGPTTCDNQQVWLEALTGTVKPSPRFSPTTTSRFMKSCMSWRGALG